MAACLAGSASAQRAPLRSLPLEAAIDREMEGFGATGAVVAVVAGGELVVHEAVGFIDRARLRPMQRDLLFGTGGLEELFDALTIVLVAADARISLDAPIRTYAPDLPPRVGSMTIAQLLSHTAGLDDAPDPGPGRRGPASRVWPGATDRALFTEPGRIHSPSRLGFPLARAIVAERLGRPFDDVVAESLLEPAGLERTTHSAVRAELRGAAPGHVVSHTSAGPQVSLTPAQNPLPQYWTTAHDLAQLMRVLMDDTALPPEAGEIATPRSVRPADPADSAGMGVRISRFMGYRQLSYTGGIAGYGTLLRWLPEARTGIVILANATGAVLNESADAALERALRDAADTAVAPQVVRQFPQQVGAYAGTYANGDRIVVLEAEGDTLWWRDADVRLRVRRTGDLLEAVIDDGRVAQTFRWTRDADGNAYVVVGERAFRRQR